VDLNALLLVPLALAMFDLQTGSEEDIPADPLALLEALRRTGGRTTLFCQAGHIGVPLKDRPVLAFLEDSVVEVQPPRRGGLFHPKIWVLRFAIDDGVAYRAVVASRNLTFDQSWDTIVAVDGHASDEPGNGASLAALLRSLPGMAVRPIAPAHRDQVEAVAAELQTVHFPPPAPASSLSFLVHGLPNGQGRPWPFPAEWSRAVVVSPFVSRRFLDRLPDGKRRVLVSRPDSLDRLPPEALDGFEVRVLHDQLVVAPGGEASGGLPPWTGLHAKAFIFDEDGQGITITGSANATEAGFGVNVETVVELRGPRTQFGAASVLDADEQPRLLDVLLEYEASQMNPTDEEDDGRALSLLCAQVAALRWAAYVQGEGPYDLVLTTPPLELPPGIELVVWPITLPPARSLRPAAGGDHLRFEALDLRSLTPFFAIELHGAQLSRFDPRFVVRAEISGLPSNRLEQILALELDTAEKVMRYLLLLLSEPGTGPGDGSEWSVGVAEPSPSYDAAPALFEPLIRAVHRDPKRLRVIDRLLRDLQEGDAEARIPPGLLEVWPAIWSAHEDHIT
jgi:hypothetical protein